MEEKINLEQLSKYKSLTAKNKNTIYYAAQCVEMSQKGRHFLENKNYVQFKKELLPPYDLFGFSRR